MLGVLFLVFFIDLLPGGIGGAWFSFVFLFHGASVLAVLNCGRDIIDSFGWTILDHKESVDAVFILVNFLINFANRFPSFGGVRLNAFDRFVQFGYFAHNVHRHFLHLHHFRLRPLGGFLERIYTSRD